GASSARAEAGSGSGAGAGAAAAPSDEPTKARTCPTSTSSSSWTLISRTVPATGDGISVSTLSVEISTIGSSTSIVSPTSLSQRVPVPSVTDSPSSGRVMDSDIPPGFLSIPLIMLNTFSVYALVAAMVVQPSG